MQARIAPIQNKAPFLISAETPDIPRQLAERFLKIRCPHHPRTEDAQREHACML